MNIKLIQGLVIAGVLTLGAQANANMFDTDVTIADNNGSGNGWYGSQEDQEVEPGMDEGQKWDLEGTFIDGNILTLVGGYDFANGEDGFYSGDVFLSTSEPVYGDIHDTGRNGNEEVDNTYGYTYVLDLDFTTGTYNVVAIDSNSSVLEAYYTKNEGSSPWKYVASDDDQIIGTGSISLLSGLTDEETGFEGDDDSSSSTSGGGRGGNGRGNRSNQNQETVGSHYAMSLDLSEVYASLGETTTFYSHFTMGCGNDNLMGSWTVEVPEPATFALFGMGVLGLLIARRKSSAQITA
jgi:hypothetical protein